MSLRRETGAEREDLQECRCRLHGRSANSPLPERWSLQRCVRFMEICDPRTDSPASTRQAAEYFLEIAGKHADCMGKGDSSQPSCYVLFTSPSMGEVAAKRRVGG
ncbi:hypothetical protein, partial [Mesorhizobium sp.]